MNQGMRRRYTSTKVPVGGGAGGSNKLATSYPHQVYYPSRLPASHRDARLLLPSKALPLPVTPAGAALALGTVARAAGASGLSSRGNGDGNNNSGAGNMPGSSSGSSFAVKSTGSYADLGA